MAKPASEIWRKYKTDGVPASGPNDPSKDDIRDWSIEKEQQVEDLQESTGSLDTRVAAVEALGSSGVRWITQTVRVRSTGNVNISNGLENGDTLNGVTLATGDNVFLGSQTNKANNGIYTVPASGTASRAAFADSAAELARIGFVIQEGTVGTGERWTLALDAGGINLGTTNLEFSPVGIEPGYAAEVEAARGGEASLSDRLDIIAAASDPANLRLNSLQHTPDPFPNVGAKPTFYYSAIARNIDTALTFARSGAGYYYDQTGKLVSADTGVARFTIDPNTFVPTGIKVEPEVTNLFIRSEELNTSAWLKLNLTVTGDTSDAPDGETTADSALVTAASGGHAIGRDTSGLSTNAAHTASFYVRPNGAYTKFMIRIGTTNASDYSQAVFDTDTGEWSEFTNAGSASGLKTHKEFLRRSGYWRIGLSAQNVPATTVRVQLYVLDPDGAVLFAGDGVSTFDWFGAQLETGQSMSSYIKTVADPVTRPRDSLTFAANFVNPTSGVFVWRGRLRPSGATQYIWSVDDDTTSNYIMLRQTNTNVISVIRNVGGVGQTILSSSIPITADTDISIAFAYGLDGHRLAITGQPVSQVTGVSIPSSLTHGRLGTHRTVASSPSYADHFHFAYIPGEVSDADLNDLVGNASGSDAEGRAEFPDVKPFIHLVTDAQSLALGWNSLPVVSDTQVYNALTFGGGVRAMTSGLDTSKALIEEEDDPRGETPCTQSARTFSDLMALNAGYTTDQVQVFASTPGRQGSLLALFIPPSSSAGRYTAQIQAAAAIAQAAGKEYSASVCYWLPGESDVSEPTDPEVYKNQLKALRAYKESIVNGITGRDDPFYLVMHQTSHGVLYNTEIALAELEAAREDRNIIVLGPTFQFGVSDDDRHFSNTESRRAGAFAGKAMAAIYGEKRRPSVVEPLSATAIGTALTIKFAADYDLAFDDGTYSFVTQDEGFKVIDDTGTLTLSSISVVNNAAGRFVTMTLNRSLGANPKVRYALDYRGTNFIMQNAASGTLMDTDPTQVYIGGVLTALPNLCPSFELAIQVLATS